MPRVLKKIVRKGVRNLFGVDVVRARFDEGWAQERDYWLGVIRDFYRSTYGVELDPAQTDPSVIPPLETIVKVQRANKAERDAFFASGYRGALAYQAELLDYGFPVDRTRNILEMGVGFGRLLIHYFPFKASLYACDVTPEAVTWTRARHGHRVRVDLTAGEPPLPYDDGMFDFVYANSVFTHVACEGVRHWAAELRRIIRPGGFLIFSVLDANHYLRDIPYRDFHRDYQSPGCRDWDQDRGVRMRNYLDRGFLFSTWGDYFRVLELRSHYRDQSHLICKREH
ncbi:MAG: class I SAM-dependent methyltransferase [Burkholderiales bacterium]|nr:class I SAM-dependent methyltransferase [Burkholderiales bacterium]